MSYSLSFNEGFLLTQLFLQVFSSYFTYIETNITLMKKEKIDLIYYMLCISFKWITISAPKSYLARWIDTSTYFANKQSRELEFRWNIFILWFRKLLMLVAVKFLFSPPNIEYILLQTCIHQLKEKIIQSKYGSWFTYIFLKMLNLLHFNKKHDHLYTACVEDQLCKLCIHGQ